MTKDMRCLAVNSAALGGVVTVLLLGALLFAIHGNQVPVQVLNSITLESPTVPAQGTLRVHYDVTRIRGDCQELINRFIINDESGAVEWSSLGPPFITGVGAHQKGTTSVPLPDYIFPGRYSYRAMTTNTCGGHTFIATTPDLHFVVTERPVPHSDTGSAAPQRLGHASGSSRRPLAVLFRGGR